MQLAFNFRLRRSTQKKIADVICTLVEAALLTALAAQSVQLFWTIFTPIGPIGDWKVSRNQLPNDLKLLEHFDPFFRLDRSGETAVVTSLSIKLFGIRVDQARGGGSAIIATPDGIQSSYNVGDEIMPGVILKAVAFDNVTIEQSGVAQLLFLDQSVKPVEATGANAPDVAPGSATGKMLAPAGLKSGVAYTTRVERGNVTGLLVNPHGEGNSFNSAGLQPGDVVLKVNGRSVSSADEVVAATASPTSPGAVVFLIERDGKQTTVTAKISK